MTPSNPAPVGDEREAFEAWAGSMESWLPNIKRRYNSYEAATTAAAWHAWETRAARSTVQQVGADVLDAARYRWLREQDWFDGPLCVLRDPKRVLTKGIGLGADCPSRDRLDAAVDAAMGKSDGGKES